MVAIVIILYFTIHNHSIIQQQSITDYCKHIHQKKIIVTDKSGKVFKKNVSAKGKGSLQLDASTLSSGANQYSLYVDRKLIDTKQMVLAK